MLPVQVKYLICADNFYFVNRPLTEINTITPLMLLNLITNTLSWLPLHKPPPHVLATIKATWSARQDYHCCNNHCLCQLTLSWLNLSRSDPVLPSCACRAAMTRR